MRGTRKSSSGVEKPIGLSTGRELDKETGLYYYRARYYDPMEGRFVSKDPIGFGGGDVNLYGYVQNNPIILSDPFGLIAMFCQRAAFKSGTNKKGKNYIPGSSHCYVVAKGDIFSWHPDWAGGVDSAEFPSTNDCTSLHCTDKNGKNKDKELEDCIYQNGLDLIKHPGSLWVPGFWDCCDIAKSNIRNCRARLGCCHD